MARKAPEHAKQDDETAEGSEGRKKGSSETLPKGGMSPLADRADSEAWTARREPLDARGVRALPQQRGQGKAPEEPVGGFVEASTGRGHIRVGPNTAPGSRPGLGEQIKKAAARERPIPDLRHGAENEGVRTHVGRRVKKLRAAAEVAARERQEEDRNYQDAVKDMAADDDGYDADNS